MLKNIKLLLLSLLLIGVFLVPTAGAVSIKDSVCQGTNLSFSNTTITQNPGESTADFAKRQATANCQPNGADESKLDSLLAKIINIISIIVGIIAVIMIIIGGFKYITSGGDSGKVSSAKNTIIYAVVGLIIVALAQFIVKFVLGSASIVG